MVWFAVAAVFGPIFGIIGLHLLTIHAPGLFVTTYKRDPDAPTYRKAWRPKPKEEK